MTPRRRICKPNDLNSTADSGWVPKTTLERLSRHFGPDVTRGASLLPSSVVYLWAGALRHIGGLAGMAANRRIRSRIARYRRHGTATSAHGNVTDRAWCTILLPILSRSG